jgi:RecA-family ATPase
MLHHHHFKHTRNSNSNTYSGKLGQAQIYSRDERELRTKPKKKIQNDVHKNEKDNFNWQRRMKNFCRATNYMVIDFFKTFFSPSPRFYYSFLRKTYAEFFLDCRDREE